MLDLPVVQPASTVTVVHIAAVDHPQLAESVVAVSIADRIRSGNNFDIDSALPLFAHFAQRFVVVAAAVVSADYNLGRPLHSLERVHFCVRNFAASFVTATPHRARAAFAKLNSDLVFEWALPIREWPHLVGDRRRAASSLSIALVYCFRDDPAVHCYRPSYQLVLVAAVAVYY